MKRHFLNLTLYSTALLNKYFNIDQRNIETFIESFKHLAQNKNEETLIQLANSIKSLYENYQNIIENEFESHTILFNWLKNKFENIRGEYFSKRNRHYKCDIVTIIEKITRIVIKLKMFNRRNSKDALNQIVDNEYYQILSDETIIY